MQLRLKCMQLKLWAIWGIGLRKSFCGGCGIGGRGSAALIYIYSSLLLSYLIYFTLCTSDAGNGVSSAGNAISSGSFRRKRGFFRNIPPERRLRMPEWWKVRQRSLITEAVKRVTEANPTQPKGAHNNRSPICAEQKEPQKPDTDTDI